MYPVRFRTNLDLLPGEEWPTGMSCIPPVGTKIESFTNRSGRHLYLEVVGISYKVAPTESYYHWEIELGIPKPFKTITEFYEYYARLTGKSVSYFI